MSRRLKVVLLLLVCGLFIGNFYMVSTSLKVFEFDLPSCAIVGMMSIILIVIEVTLAAIPHAIFGWVMKDEETDKESE